MFRESSRCVAAQDPRCDAPDQRTHAFSSVPSRLAQRPTPRCLVASRADRDLVPLPGSRFGGTR